MIEIDRANSRPALTGVLPSFARHCSSTSSATAWVRLLAVSYNAVNMTWPLQIASYSESSAATLVLALRSV